jgi:hypothetical protein
VFIGQQQVGHYLGRTSLLGDVTLAIARSLGEGDPTVVAGTVAVFQNNILDTTSGGVAIVVGTAASATLGFGDKDNPSAGYLLWSNISSTFSLGGVLLA